MKYQSSNNIIQLRRQHRRNFLMLVCGVLLVVGAIFGLAKLGISLFGADFTDVVAAKAAPSYIERHRIVREAIPDSRLMQLGYGTLFNDLNDVQLDAAMRNGLRNPESISDLDGCSDLMKIVSCNKYYVDNMTHSSPYLVPEAVLMLSYIGERFAQVQKEYSSDGHYYRPIITSALRTQENVNTLRRRNSNASENSCHCFGTTIDITYIRFLRDDGEIVNEEWLKRALAETLYELRYEGICYVKYERRQACFHITLLNTDYQGSQKSELKKYAKISGVKDHDHSVVRETITKLFKESSKPQSHPSYQGTFVEY